MHSRRKRRFWQSSSFSPGMHLRCSGRGWVAVKKQLWEILWRPFCKSLPLCKNTLHADHLAIWNVSEHTIIATYRNQEAINGINKWTQDWGLEINTGKTNHTFLLPFHLKGTDKTEAEGWDRTPNRHPHLPGCETGHTTYLEATDTEVGEKQSAETSLDEKARRNYLVCRLINSDQSLHSNSTTNHGVRIHYMGNGCQDQ